MVHDQHFISKRLKSQKHALENGDLEVFYEMAIDMEFPYAEETKERRPDEESC